MYSAIKIDNNGEFVCFYKRAVWQDLCYAAHATESFIDHCRSKLRALDRRAGWPPTWQEQVSWPFRNIGPHGPRMARNAVQRPNWPAFSGFFWRLRKRAQWPILLFFWQFLAVVSSFNQLLPVFGM
jgi:hypothetical protein